MRLQLKPRPRFALWRYQHGLNLKATAALIEDAGRELGFEDFTCSDETVRLICLVFEDERRRVPGAQTLAAIVRLTAGEIGEGDFYPPKQAAA